METRLAASDNLTRWIAAGDVGSLNGRRIFTRVAQAGTDRHCC